MSDKNSGYVITHEKGKIAEIEFFHPASNSLPGDLLHALKLQILEAGRQSNINCIVIKSGGDRAFCAGASFEELLAVDDFNAGKKFFTGFADVINAIRTCGKIVIARIQGKTVGGGVGIAAAADMTFATKFSAVRLSELAIGIGPFVIGPAVERKVGTSSFTYLSLTPDEWQSADSAKNMGLYNEVFEDINQLDDYLLTITQKLSKYNPEALEQLKTVFWKDTSHWSRLLDERAEISGKLVLSDFTREAIAAFKQKK